MKVIASIIGAALLCAASCGCATTATQVGDGEAVGLTCTLRHDYVDIDWKDLNGAYNASMFDVVKVRFQGRVIRLLGFEPTIGRIYYYSDEPIVTCSLWVGSANMTFIHLFLADGRFWYLLTTDSTRPIQIAAELEPEELLAVYWHLKDLLTQVDSKAVYVYWRFLEDIRSKGVELPKSALDAGDGYEVTEIRRQLEEKYAERRKDWPEWARKYHVERLKRELDAMQDSAKK